MIKSQGCITSSVMTSLPDTRAEDNDMTQQAAGECSYRKQHVLFVLVDSSGVRNRVGVFDDGHRLA